MSYNKEGWHQQPLTIVVFGASGDLAKKKTFPALFDLFLEGALPSKTIIYGYSRSKISGSDLHKKLTPFLKKAHKDSDTSIKKFFELVCYHSGQYGSPEDLEKCLSVASGKLGSKSEENRLYYFALPPDVFIPAAASVDKAGRSKTGFTRLIVEKPFGHDLESAEKMSKDLGELFPEENLYRIDHYLGKEMVQAMLTLRFSNAWLEPLLNNQFVQSVMITFKEDIGTGGRGGYFDKSGIIRDIMQNHLMQVLAVVAMEGPQKVIGEEAGDLIRDEKVKVLKCIKPWKLDSTVLGQYTGNDSEPGYLEDETVPKGSRCPTFASTVMTIDNKRWAGVPFIMKAGKALDERKCEVRIQLKPPPGVNYMFNIEEDSMPPLNEIVIRIQPGEAVWIKNNVKQPGLSNAIVQSHLDLTYQDRYPSAKIPNAYTRLLLAVLRGQQQNFVRKDELIQAWKIVTPLLKHIDSGKVNPLQYKFGSRGPEESDALSEKIGKWDLRRR